MLATLLLVCVFFYMQTREFQDKYTTSMQHTYRRLELVNKLFENKERTQALVRAHIMAERAAAKDSLRRELALAYKANEATILELHQLLEGHGHLQQLHRLSDDLKNYHAHVDSLLRLSYERQREAALRYDAAHLAPFYTQHHAHLISLNSELTNAARTYTDQFSPAFSNLVDEYILLLLLVVPFIFWASFAFNQITKRLQQENQRLNKEIKEREALQQNLKFTQRHFRRLFEQNPIPMFVYDQHTFRILEVNEAAVQEYGFTQEEFLRLTVFDILPEEEKEAVRSRISQMDKAADTNNVGVSHMRKDGSIFRVMLRSHAFKERNGVYPRLVTSENIQKQEEFIATLAKSEKQLREVSSSIPGAVYQFRVDEHNNTSFPFVSDGIKDVVGVTPEEVYQNPNLLFEAVHPDDLEEVSKSIQAATQSFLPWVQDLRVWNKVQQEWNWIRGHSLPSSKENGVLLYNGTFIDITDQKEAQAQLTASEANLRALLDSSPQAVYLLDKELNVLLFNAVAAEEVKKLTLRELQPGQNILELTSDDQKNILIDSHARALQGKPTQFETGSGELWFEIAFRPVLTHDRQVISVALSIHDISEQRNIISAIKNSEAQLARAQSLAKIGSWEYDLLRDSLRISDNLYTIYGVSPETFAVTLNSLQAFFHPEDRDKALQDYQRVIEEKTVVSAEHRIRLHDGSEKYLHQTMEPLMNYEGQVLKVLGTTQDITEQKAREREIREAKDRFQSTIENIPEVIFSADANFRIFYISPQCVRITGYTEEEFTQEHLWPRITHEEDLPGLLSKLKQEVPLGKKIQHEMRIIARDGKEKWFMLRLSPMLGENGEVQRLDASVADVTERKLEEAKRTLLTEQLQVQNQNLQQFAYIVSHNLRAPIANIMGLTTIYDRARPEADLNKHIIDSLAQSARLLDHTIRDLNHILTVRGQMLDVSEQVYFEELLQDILKSISIELENTQANVAYDFSHAPSIVSLRSYIHSILQNLLTNALKYRDPQRKPEICIRSYKQKDYICIEISDNGLGIDLAKVKGNLFGLYKRFHQHIEGRGLGLHLVKTQVDLLGGKIEVDSRVGAGTTFKVYI
ncbi:PAS domain S-box protein [Pontibacter kalidii]|uniref:PAS domain S-box protein n=1 Tax=Pontibacter kalidii TaxID=2592049 RepID=UPI00224D07D4|nr:PAS domain S-box protein [Pontibacter kalidii]